MLGIVRPLEGDALDADASGQRQFANLTLSEEQQIAQNAIVQRVKEKTPVTTLAGFAGTGKSVLTGVLAAIFEDMGLRVAYAAPTGKAAGVLRRSLAANGVNPPFCGTCHRLIYKPSFDAVGNITGWQKAERVFYDLIVVDEASMVNKTMAEDLMSFKVPLLFVGDHGQLPPVGEEVGLMATPDLTLRTVRRQALNNPIIALSFLIRAGGDWKKFVQQTAAKSEEIVHQDRWSYMDYILGLWDGFQNRPMSEDPLIVTWTNGHRNELNQAVRIGLGTDAPLVVGERVINLKNAYLTGALVANGFRGRVTKLNYARNVNHVGANVVFADEGIALDEGMMNRHQFGQSATFRALDEIKGDPRAWDEVGLLFDYGYALTCHKAQGSQADHVIVKADRGKMDDSEWKRWLYTAATRAQKKLTIIY